MSVDNPKHQQHMLNNKMLYDSILSPSTIEGKKILELGVGTAMLTNLICKYNPEKIRGYEIDESFSSFIPKDVEMIYGDFTQEDFSFIDDSWVVISNPPYETLGFIEEKILSKTKNAIIMIPEKRMRDYSNMGFGKFLTFEGKDFYPPSKGEHLVVARGVPIEQRCKNYIAYFKYSDNNNCYKYHREDGPAMISANTEAWYYEGMFHRTDGPAYTNYEIEMWFKFNHLHREDGPAVTRSSKENEWWNNGKRHRLDGPAVTGKNIPEYWISGKRIFSKKEFDRKVKMFLFG